jgi:hypothetical protein
MNKIKKIFFMIVCMVLFSCKLNAQNIYRTWHSNSPGFCLILKKDSTSYIHEPYEERIKTKIKVKKNKIIFKKHYRPFVTSKAIFKIKKFTEDTLVLELIKEHGFDYFDESMNSNLLIFKSCDTCICPCPDFGDCPMLISMEEYCSPKGLFHSNDSALFIIIDTLEVEGYLVEYNRKYVSSKSKNFLNRTFKGEKRDTFILNDGMLLYFDSLDIVDGIENLNTNDSFLHFFRINNFITDLRFYKWYIERCHLDSMMGAHYINYPEFTNLSFFKYRDYDYGINAHINTIINDTTIHYEKVILEKRIYNIYLCRVSLKYWERVYPRGVSLFRKYEKDGWLYFGIPVISGKTSPKLPE